MLTVGFAGAPPEASALEVDHRNVVALTPTSATLVLYGRFINLRKGDRIHFVASGPQGFFSTKPGRLLIAIRRRMSLSPARDVATSRGLPDIMRAAWN